MARPNETGHGTDQRGFRYEVSYQPDWFRRLQVTRRDSNGDETTVTIFANPESHGKEKKPKNAKTKVKSDEVDFTLDVHAEGAVKYIEVAYEIPADGGKGNGDDDEGEVVIYTIDDDQPPPPTEPGGGS